MERRTILPGFVGDALASLTRSGLDPAPVLAKAGIADPDQPVSNLQYGWLWLAITDLIQDEFFGMGARPMRPGSFNLLCQAVLHARTLEHALRRALSFLTVVLDDPAGELRLRDGLAEIVLTDRVAPRPAFAYRTYWLVLMGVMCWLIGRRIPLMQVDFACPAPENRSDYLQFFGAPVRFDQPQSRLVFAGPYLGLPPIRSEKALQGFLRGAPANILLRYRHDQDLSARIRDRLRGTPPEDWPDFNRLAADLRLSPATLRRRLRGEGQGFAAIRDEIRELEARRMLAETDARVADIASRLGYAEPSAFHRAFMKWTGMSPGAFRDANPAPPSPAPSSPAPTRERSAAPSGRAG
jgi:AraC-like DNA-binding protein